MPAKRIFYMENEATYFPLKMRGLARLAWFSYKRQIESKICRQILKYVPKGSKETMYICGVHLMLPLFCLENGCKFTSRSSGFGMLRSLLYFSTLVPEQDFHDRIKRQVVQINNAIKCNGGKWRPKTSNDQHYIKFVTLSTAP